MDTVCHIVRSERSENRILNVCMTGNISKCQGMSGIQQPADVLVQLIRPTVGNAQAFPHGISPLHHAVEHAYFGISARHQSIHPDLGLGVAGIGLIEFGHESVDCLLA